MKTARGFTLIELLVVIAIIGLLAAVVLASLNTARVKGRDARRTADMDEIRKAVELYYSDNGHYPNSNGTWTSFDSPNYKVHPIITPNASNLAAALAPYISGAVGDPQTVVSDAGYLYIGAGESYCILIWRTPENMKDFGTSLIPTNRCTLPITSGGTCTSGTNSLYIGVGSYANGC